MLYLQFSRTIKRISRDLLKKLKARRRNQQYVELSNHVVHRLSLTHSVVVSLLVPHEHDLQKDNLSLSLFVSVN